MQRAGDATLPPGGFGARVEQDEPGRPGGEGRLHVGGVGLGGQPGGESSGEEVTGRISGLGAVTTSVVYSSPLTGRAIEAPAPAGDPSGPAARTGADGGQAARRRRSVAN